MTIIVVCLAGVVLFGLVIWGGTGMLRNSEGGSTGVGNALGSGLADFFDPGQARSMRDLQEQMDKTEVAPTPTGDGPLRVDLSTGVARVRTADRPA